MNRAYNDMPFREWVRQWRTELDHLEIHLRAVFENEESVTRPLLDSAAANVLEAKRSLEYLERMADETGAWRQQP